MRIIVGDEVLVPVDSDGLTLCPGLPVRVPDTVLGLEVPMAFRQSLVPLDLAEEGP